MCLSFDKNITANLKKNIDPNTVWQCWKVYERRGNSLFSPTYNTEKQIKPGEIVSDRKNHRLPLHNLTPLEEDNGTVFYGIHVCLNKREARRYRWIIGSGIILPVTAKQKDLIAISDSGRAVFSKIHLKRKDYREAIAKGRKVK